MVKDSVAVESRVGELAHRIVACGIERGVTVATAESLTAGLISASIAAVPGASEVLLGGVASYTEDIKHRVLGVSLETLDTYTAVSTPCAREMAEGVRELMGAAVAVSATGYAGPGGGTPEDPVGTVYIGVATEGDTIVERCSFAGERNEVRWQVVERALQLVLGKLM